MYLTYRKASGIFTGLKEPAKWDLGGVLSEKSAVLCDIKSNDPPGHRTWISSVLKKTLVTFVQSFIRRFSCSSLRQRKVRTDSVHSEDSLPMWRDPCLAPNTHFRIHIRCFPPPDAPPPDPCHPLTRGSPPPIDLHATLFHIVTFK